MITQRATHGAEVYENMQEWLAESRVGTAKLLRYNEVAALVNEITRLRDEIRGIHTVAQVAPNVRRRVAKKVAVKKAAAKKTAKKATKKKQVTARKSRR